MNVNSSKLPKNILEVTVEISLEEMQKHLNTAAKQLSQNMKIDGFRPGLAPLNVIINKVGEMGVWQKAAEIAFDSTINSSIEKAKEQLKEKFEIIGVTNLAWEKLAPQNPLIYKAQVALLPKVELPNLDEIKVKPKKLEVDEKKVDDSLVNLQDMRASEVLIDRETKDNDKVVIDFSISRDNIPIDNGSYKKYALILGKKQMIPGFEENIVGMKKDEEKKFSLKFPEQYHAKELAGKQADFKVKLLEVYERTIPELNDNFAKTLGFENLEALKNQIRSDFEHENQHQMERELETEIFEKISDKTKFEDFPEVLVDQETRKMLNELKQGVQRQGLKFEDYLAQMKKDETQLRLDFAPEAVKRIKAALIIRTIGQDEKYQATDQEIQQEIEKTKKMYPGNEDINKQVESKDFQNYLKNVISNNKVIAMLKEKIAGVKPHQCDHHH